MWEAIAAIVAAILNIGTGVVNAASANLQGYRALRDHEIATNQAKDLAVYQVTAVKSRTESIVIISGFVFLGLMLLVMFYKKK